MNKKIIFALVLATVVALPLVTSAIPPTPTEGQVGSIDDLWITIGDVIWKIFAIIALVSFVIAGILFVTAGGAPDKVATARQAAIYGVIGIIVAVLAYSIIGIAASLITG